MTRRELGALVFRITAICLWFEALRYLISMAYMIIPMIFMMGGNFGAPSLMYPIFSIVPALLYAGAGLYIVRRAEFLGGGLFPYGRGDEPLTSIALVDAQTVAFSALGCYLFVTALPKAISIFPFFDIMLSVRAMAGPRTNPSNAFAEGVVQCVLGALLFFGGRALSEFLLRIRGVSTYSGIPAGTPPVLPEPETDTEDEPTGEK